MSSTSLPLFDTWKAARERIAGRKQAMYGRILRFARDRGWTGLTCDELASTWACSHNHVCPRISELQKSGRLVPTSRTRPTRSGSPARVFVLPEFAESEHRDDG